LSHENTDLSLEVISFVRDLFDTEIEEESVQVVLDLYNTFVRHFNERESEAYKPIDKEQIDRRISAKFVKIGCREGR